MWWTFAAACVASVTALIIAFVAYPWQKRKDRELQLQSETRATYCVVLSAFNLWFAALARNQLSDAKERYYDFVDQIMRLQLYANRDVLLQARSLIDVTKEYRAMRMQEEKNPMMTPSWRSSRSELFRRVKDERTKFILECRSHLLAEKIATSAEIVDSFAPIEESEK